MKSNPFDETYAEFHDPEFAAAYLQSALEDGVKEFLTAFLMYLQVTESLEKVAETVSIPPSLLQLWLTSTADPGLKHVCELLKAGGMRVGIEAKIEEVTI